MNPIHFIVATYLYFFMVIGTYVICIHLVYKTQRKYLPDKIVDVDYWIWGMFYYNPEDRRIFLPSQWIPSCINRGRPVGRLLSTFLSMLRLFGFLACIWSIFIEFTPVDLSIQQDQLIVSQIGTEYTLDISSIQKVELMEDIPTELLSTDVLTIIKGEYSLNDEETINVFLDPKNEFFLHIVSDEGHYLLSSSTNKDTIAIYDELYNQFIKSEFNCHILSS